MKVIQAIYAHFSVALMLIFKTSNSIFSVLYFFCLFGFTNKFFFCIAKFYLVQTHLSNYTNMPYLEVVQFQFQLLFPREQSYLLTNIQEMEQSNGNISHGRIVFPKTK